MATIAYDRKDAKIQHDIISWFYHFFSKHQNKAEFMKLDDSEILSSDFPGLRTFAAWKASISSTTSVALKGNGFLKQIFHKKLSVLILL